MKKIRCTLSAVLFFLGISSICTKAGEESIEISFMTTGTGDARETVKADLEDRLLEQFPNITITVETYPDEQYYTVLNTRLSTGNGPDFFYVQPYLAGPNSVQKLAAAGHLEPLNDLGIIQSADEEETAPMTWEGNIYSLSPGEMILCTYYNEEIFAEYDLDIPQNWEEFLSCCEILQQNDIQPILSGGKDAYTLQFGIYQIAASQVYAANPDYNAELYQGLTHFTDPGTWDETISRFLLLYDEGYVQAHSLKMSDAEAVERFGNGEAAMLFSGNFRYEQLMQSVDGKFTPGCFPLPGNDRGEPTYAVISKAGAYGINAASGHTQLCKQIFEVLYSDSETYRRYNDFFGSILERKESGCCTINCNQGWGEQEEWVLEDGLSRYIGGEEITAEDIAAAMQEKLESEAVPPT